jgi:NADH-quinone oxidoreductase subunit G
MCDDGRYGWHHLHDPARLLSAGRLVSSSDDRETVEWSDVTTRLRQELSGAGRLAVAVSPMLTLEEAWMLCATARSIDQQAALFVGHVPVSGSDESFPGGFTIRAEKCPNRRGVEAVVALFESEERSWGDLVAAVSAGEFDAAWITAGYPHAWIDDTTAAPFGKLRSLVVQDLFDSPLAKLATWRLPAAGFAERAGTWVNAAHRAQVFAAAVRAPAGVWPEGRLYWNMLGRRGLYDPAAVRRQIAESSASLAALGGEIPAVGVDLRIDQLASS